LSATVDQRRRERATVDLHRAAAHRDELIHRSIAGLLLGNKAPSSQWAD
jgi:hypothetical protein